MPGDGHEVIAARPVASIGVENAGCVLPFREGSSFCACGPEEGLYSLGSRARWDLELRDDRGFFRGSHFAQRTKFWDQFDRAIRPIFPRKACAGAWVMVSASFRHQRCLADSLPAK